MLKLTASSALHKSLTATRPYRTSACTLQAYRPRISTKKNYYDVLGISAKATHAQVKTAFYSLSKIYHPDVNQGDSGASAKFSEITEAYNVLGNHTLRRRYDKGILGPRDFRGEVKAEPARAPMQKKGKIFTGTMYNTRGEKVFDFDEFYRSTYGEQLAEEQRRRQRKKFVKKMEEIRNQKENKFLLGETGLFLGGLALIYLLYALGVKNPLQMFKKEEDK